MSKILITGGAGFIASSLAEKLIINKAIFVVSIDNFLTGRIAHLPTSESKNYEFIACDVNNIEQLSNVMLKYQFDYVFHYAAVVGVKRTLDNPLMVLQDIEGIKNILKLCKETNVKRIFFSSSSEVYGEPVEFPQNEETTPLNSKLPYAVVKNIGEAFIKAYHKEYGLKYTIFRFFNTYGNRQSDDFVIAKFLNLALNNEDITLYGDGLQTRTFCHIDDNLEVTLKVLKGNLAVNQVINIGSDLEISILELAKLIIQGTNSRSKIVHLPPLKEGDMSRRMPDIYKMKKILGKELVTLEKGINKLVSNK